MRGQAGGRACLELHGKAHYSEIGRLGLASTAERYFDGDRAAAMTGVRKVRNERAVDKLADLELDRELAEGKQVASTELPVYLYPDDDQPPY